MSLMDLQDNGMDWNGRVKEEGLEGYCMEWNGRVEEEGHCMNMSGPMKDDIWRNKHPS